MIELLLIGDELVCGSTTDANAAAIACALQRLGCVPARITVVGDRIEAIVRELRMPLPDTHIVIVTGGLGPTNDDRTARAAAEAFGRPLTLNGEALAHMERFFAGRGRTITRTNRTMALMPQGCAVIPNPAGTACGFVVEEGARHILFLPGVPAEVRALLDSFVAGFVAQQLGGSLRIVTKTLKVFGLRESEVYEKLKGVLSDQGPVSLGYYPQYPEIRLRLTARGTRRDALEQELQRAARIICEQLGEHIYADSDTELEQVVGELLSARCQTIAVAESCTGGLITSRLTSVPGSSRYVDRSVVTYSNRAKEEMLGVPRDVLQACGAVSEPVACLMAEGVRRISAATYGLSVTGIAGPDGGTPDKPVGTVCIAVADEYGARACRYRFAGTREQVTLMSCHTALSLLRRAMLGMEWPRSA